MNWRRSSIASAVPMLNNRVQMRMCNGYYGLLSVAAQQSWADIRIDVMSAGISAFHITVAVTDIVPNARIPDGSPG